MSHPTPVTDASPIAPVDLVAERAEVGPALEQAVLECLHSGQYVLGPYVQAFEEAFARYSGVEHCVGVASGTDALILALKAAGVAHGDEVVTSPFTFFASAGAVAWCGATPKLADVEEDTALLDPALAAEACGPRTRCVLPVHLYGQLADMDAFRALCDEKGLALVEDAAQAHGARRGNYGAGERGDSAAFSFYPTKNLGAAGDGGAVLTSNPEVATRLRRLRDHGSPEKYRHDEIGTNSRLAALQAVVLSAKLPHLETWNERRRSNAAYYDEALADVPGARPLRRVDGAVHAYHQYTVRIPDGRRDLVLTGLKKRGIHAAIHYPSPVHLQKALAPLGHHPGDFPNAEALAAEVLCLPVHPFLKPEELERVAGGLRELAG